MRKAARRLNEMYHEAQFDEGAVVVSKTDHHQPRDLDYALSVIASLKACTDQNNLPEGIDIHVDIARRGELNDNVYVGNTLLSMYAKCGALCKAQEVFDGLSEWNVVSWNALISGYAQHGHGEKAILCFEWMQSEGFSPDACSFACTLKACGSVGALDKGQILHAQIVKVCLLERHIMVGNALVDMYVKCGDLGKGQEVFDELAILDLVSWTALIAGYAQHGYGEEALHYFEQMQVAGISPNAVTFACVLKACGSIVQALRKGQEIHAQIVRGRTFERNTLVSNALVDMYVKCGALEKAQEVLNDLLAPNVIAWTSLIAGYTEHGHSEEALSCFECMRERSISPNAVTFACVLRACGSISDLERGQEIHGQIERERLVGKDIMVGNALIDMYIKCGVLEKAQKLFDELPFQNVVSWTMLIAGYADHGHGEKAIRCFETMQLQCLPPNEVTFACILKACGSVGAIDRGQDIHAQIAGELVLEKSVMVGNALVEMYIKCGTLEKARRVFDELPARNVVSWNGLIAGYVQHDCCEEALSCFEQMQLGGFFPNAVTFACILQALGSIGSLDRGQEIHAQIVKDCILGDIVLANALLDMYVKCGAVETAQDVFDSLLTHDIVSWNTLVSGYAHFECNEETLSCFERMQVEGFSPDLVTFASALKACGILGAASKGKRLHSLVKCRVRQAKDGIVSIGLLVLYANCGMLREAQKLFSELPVRDVVAWSALMEGYAQLGKYEVVLSLFKEMIREGVDPDPITFTVVLTACSHGGLLDMGQMYFEMLSKRYGITATPEHHTCMVDLLSRAGHLDKASVVIEEMPLSANLLIWHTLLGGCQKWVDMTYGQVAFKNAVQLDEDNSSSYVTMRNILSAASRQEDVG